MNKKLMKDKNLILFLILIIPLAGLMFILPILGDDLLHGSYGMGFNFLADINGRYLGNLFGVNLSSSLILRVIIKSIVISSIAFCIYKISNSKKSSILLFAFLGVLFLPKEFFRQVILNSSGFGNYVVPTLGILFIIYFHFKTDIFENKLYIPLLFLLGMFNSLFVEHVTIYNLVLSLFLLIYSCFKDKNRKFYFLAYFIGSVVGSILMFTNPVYMLTFKGEDEYRSITSLLDYASKFTTIVNEAFFNNVFIVLSILIITLAMSFHLKSRKRYSIVLKFISGFFLTYYLVHVVNPSWMIFEDKQILINTILSLLMLVNLIVIVLLVDIDKYSKYKLLLLLVSYVILLGPLLVVNPIGPRCYYSSYILLWVFIIKSLVIFDKKNWINIDNLNYISIPFIICVYILLYSIYGEVYLESKERIINIRNAIAEGNDEVEFTPLSHMEYLHGAEICPEYNERVYRMYYNIDEDIKFIKEGCN